MLIWLKNGKRFICEKPPKYTSDPDFCISIILLSDRSNSSILRSAAPGSSISCILSSSFSIIPEPVISNRLFFIRLGMMSFCIFMLSASALLQYITCICISRISRHTLSFPVRRTSVCSTSGNRDMSSEGMAKTHPVSARCLILSSEAFSYTSTITSHLFRSNTFIADSITALRRSVTSLESTVGDDNSLFTASAPLSLHCPDTSTASKRRDMYCWWRT